MLSSPYGYSHDWTIQYHLHEIVVVTHVHIVSACTYKPRTTDRRSIESLTIRVSVCLLCVPLMLCSCTSRPDSSMNGPGCCAPPSSSSCWPRPCMWACPACPTTCTTGVTCSLASCREQWWLFSL